MYQNQNSRLKRSSDYRNRYFKQHKGLFGKIYFCPYCGKVLVNKRKIQVDHIQSIKNVQTKKFLRRKFSKLEDGVNDIRNLTASCIKCNSKKAYKGGSWVFLGWYGIYFMPIIRFTLIITVFIFFAWLYSNQPIIQNLIYKL